MKPVDPVEGMLIAADPLIAALRELAPQPLCVVRFPPPCSARA